MLVEGVLLGLQDPNPDPRDSVPGSLLPSLLSPRPTKPSCLLATPNHGAQSWWGSSGQRILLVAEASGFPET